MAERLPVPIRASYENNEKRFPAGAISQDFEHFRSNYLIWGLESGLQLLIVLENTTWGFSAAEVVYITMGMKAVCLRVRVLAGKHMAPRGIVFPQLQVPPQLWAPRR